MLKIIAIACLISRFFQGQQAKEAENEESWKNLPSDLAEHRSFKDAENDDNKAGDLNVDNRKILEFLNNFKHLKSFNEKSLPLFHRCNVSVLQYFCFNSEEKIDRDDKHLSINVNDLTGRSSEGGKDSRAFLENILSIKGRNVKEEKKKREGSKISAIVGGLGGREGQRGGLVEEEGMARAMKRRWNEFQTICINSMCSTYEGRKRVNCIVKNCEH